MGIHFNSGRKDTGRTDKYSDETPLKDYQDYRNDYPLKDENAREIARDITLKKRPVQFIGKKSLEVRKQELVSHIQSYQETFSHQAKKAWINKLKELNEALGF